jgi:hypothetical protein
MLFVSLLGVAGCARSPSVDLCTPDDGFKAALAGGQLHAEVRAADGTPLAAGDAAVDRASSLGLGHAEEGEWIVLEAVDGAAVPLAYGAARVHDQSACVCMSRTSWYAYATWQDSAGAFYDGQPVGFFVHDAKQRAPGVDARAPLSLDHARVQSGDVLRATTQYGNDATVALDVRALEVLARPPGASHAAGLVRDFSLVPVGNVAAGATVSVDASRAFGPNDVAGDWAVFTRLTDALGVVHDGPETTFTVGGADTTALVATAPPRLNAAWFSPLDTLHVTASYANPGTAPVTLQQLVLTARPPGGSNASGPFDDLSGRLGVTTVGAGQQLDVAGDRAATLADDPCAGMVCVVSGGTCKLSPTP